MKCKVRLTYAVEMFVEADSMDSVTEWLNNTTPAEAKAMATNMVEEDYSEEVICQVQDDSIVDYVIQ